MKRFVTLVIALVVSQAMALAEGDGDGFWKSIFPDHVSKKEVLEQNQRLKASLDSLQAVVDSLSVLAREGDRSLAEKRIEMAQDSTCVDVTEYDADVSDSLMKLWFSSRRIADLEYETHYDINEANFTTNVPDSVLMARLKAMNAYITLPFNSTVKNYMILYSEKMPKLMNRVMGLASYYMPIFEETFARYGLPLELKYMAVIESHLDATAESRAGARGMWQFMYGTAKNYGLKINSFVDERLDVQKAADAAARYLSDSYKVFGDWPLAISSYNCGPGNVQKAIKRAGSSKFWDVYYYLPRETRGYVPAMVGAMYAMRYYKEYNIVPEDVGMPALTDTFEIRKNLHFKQIEEVAGIPMSVIKEYNPEYIHQIIPGNEGVYVLKLPFTYTNSFMDADRDSLYLHKAGQLISPQIIKGIKESGGSDRIAYKVKSGDYLGKIASRNHCTVAQLKKWNKLKSDKLRIGQILYIYRR